jgi:2-dehydropantoate 2-reductase
VEALAREAAPVVGISPSAAIRRVMDVAKATAGNRSSMLQDILAGRRTEIEDLTGALLRLARRRRVNVPTHAAFYQLIRVIEAG